MTFGISDASLSHPVGLVAHGKDFDSPCAECPRRRRIGILDNQVHANCRPAQGCRTDIERFGVFIDNEEPQPVDA